MTRSTSLLRVAAAPIAWPAVLLYAMGVRLKDAAYQLRLIRPRQLSWPVISVGNLSTGGAGKTSFVLLLAQLMEQHGWSADVLSRGYRRKSNRIARVDVRQGWREFGDEPFLLAQHGLPVTVDADRYRAGLLAESDLSPDKRPIHLLDDGFQHRKLARAVDILLLRRNDLNDEMLPVGRLREPLAAIQRADICVLRSEDSDLSGRVLQLMRLQDPARIWIVNRRTVVSATTDSSVSAHPGLAFCAIGDPSGFFAGLHQAGVNISAEVVFRDHHTYREDDIARLKNAARKKNARFFITTEKDIVRLTAALRSEIEKEFPLVVAGLELSLRHESECMATLEKLLRVAKPRASSNRKR